MSYDFAPIGYFTLDSDGSISDLNFTGVAKKSCNVKLGYNGNSLEDVYIEGIVTGEDRICLLSVVDISELKYLLK